MKLTFIDKSTQVNKK